MVQNLELQSKGLESRIAALEIRRQRSGYLPTLDIVGSYGRTDTGGSIYGDGQDIKDGQIGLQFRMPFSIGRTSSLVREAAARSNAARFERDHERLATEREVRSSFYSIISSSKKLEALRKMVIAQDSALQLRIAGLKGGFETSVTVLDAYRLYYASRYDFLQARYEYLINRLKLKKSVGVLTRSDLEDLAALINQYSCRCITFRRMPKYGMSLNIMNILLSRDHGVLGKHVLQQGDQLGYWLV